MPYIPKTAAKKFDILKLGRQQQSTSHRPSSVCDRKRNGTNGQYNSVTHISPQMPTRFPHFSSLVICPRYGAATATVRHYSLRGYDRQLNESTFWRKEESKQLVSVVRSTPWAPSNGSIVCRSFAPRCRISPIYPVDVDGEYMRKVWNSTWSGILMYQIRIFAACLLVLWKCANKHHLEISSINR